MNELQETKFLIEADDFARGVLWEKFCIKNEDHKYGIISKWKQGKSHLIEVAKTDRSICVRLDFAKLDDFPVCFWHTSSELVDYAIINEWFKKFYPHGAKCDAQNFQLCLSALSIFKLEKK